MKLAMEGYDYTIVHRPGTQHSNADGLSRLMCKWEDNGSTVKYFLNASTPSVNTATTSSRKHGKTIRKLCKSQASKSTNGNSRTTTIHKMMPEVHD